MATMDLIYQAIKADVVSIDLDRQSSSLLVALQLAASGKDISSLAPTFCSELIANSSTNVVCKKLAYDCVRISRLTADEWEIVCRGMTNDFNVGNPDLTAVSLSFLNALPSWRVGDFVTECSKDISACMVHDHATLRQVTVETLGCLLARDDMALLCATSVTLLERVNFWWTQICRSMLDTADSVSSAAFDAVGSLFSEFSTKRLSRLAGDKIISTESSLAVRSQFVISAVEFVWFKRDLLMARAAVLPLDKMRSTVYPLVYAARAVASGMLDDMKSLAGTRKGAGVGGGHPTQGGGLGGGSGVNKDLVNAERILGVSDIISHLSPFLSSSLDPALVYEVGIQVLSLAGVPGGKPEWALGPITAFLTLWDRQEYSAGREAIVKAVVSNLQLLDLHLQVALFKRLLVMVRNLRVESDRMYALACICQTALCLDLFVKESARRGQKPLAGTDVSALLEDAHTRKEFSSVSADSLFREELLACLAETCFQLSQPPPPLRSPTTTLRTNGILGNTEGSASKWAQSALEVLEVGRPCVGWDCGGRTYAMDCYLRLLTQLCLLYDTAGGVKLIADGATPEQIRAEQRLQNLQRQLLEDLADVSGEGGVTGGAISVVLVWLSCLLHLARRGLILS